MSYILDALKRADAERGRGTVPGLHAQPLPAMADAKAAGAHRRWWPLLATVLAVGGIAAGTWAWLNGGNDVRRPVAVTAGPATPPATPVAKPALGAAPEPSVQAAAPHVAPVAPLMPVPPPPGVAPTPPAAPAAGPNAPAPPVSVAVKPKAPVDPASATAPAAATAAPSASARTAGPAAKPAAAASAASATQVAPAIAPLLSELPEEIRRLIPALAITGAVYSENPAQRLLLVNGQVLPQGASAAPEVTIDEIKARSATFTYRGSRFRVTY